MKEELLVLQRKLIAKAISELTFEEIMHPILVAGTSDEYVLAMNNVSYRFKAWPSIWGNLWVDEATLVREENGVAQAPMLASTFFKEWQINCGMSDQTLSIFIEEMQQTLYADALLKEKQSKITVAELSGMGLPLIERYLNGHPKLLLNKGRMGWGEQDFARFAPESVSNAVFQLHWIAVVKECLLPGSAAGPLFESCDSATIEKFTSILKENQASWETHVVLPVHPWQWQRYIRIQYQELLQQGKMLDLGVAGDEYTPQISLRTLSNVARPKNLDIKLSLSILNTSCVRGIPLKYIASGPQISMCLNAIVQTDLFLQQQGLIVLQEKANIAVPLTIYQQLPQAPYRYPEMLGCLWRESVAQVLSPQQMAVPTAALFYQHVDGEFLLVQYVQNSGLSLQEWMQQYFTKVVLPLYHLQLYYGLGLVAHGQNTMLVLEEYRPVRLIIKDFHGDLRRSNIAVNDMSALLQKYPILQNLEVLPPEHLIHDLLTGHFITVLRYISRTTFMAWHWREQDFYLLLGQVVQSYLQQQQVLDKIHPAQNLLRPKIEKVLVNRVRFTCGYEESHTRLKPLLGSEISNPLRGEVNLCNQ